MICIYIYIYLEHPQKLLDETPPTCLYEVGQIDVQSADSGGERFHGPAGVKRPTQSLELKNLTLQRKEAQDTQTRIDLSKKIQRQAQNELRLWKIK